MINRLVGIVEGPNDDGSVTVDCQGVGYEVWAPLGTLGRARRDDVGRATLHVHTVVREDALLLYGFATLEDRAAFRVLLSVSQVGPKLAMSILGALPVAELAASVARREVARLTAISGVGKKTAERLILELKDKLLAAPGTVVAPPPAASVAAPSSGKAELLRGALERLGFRPQQVEAA
ncbi:MAG: Holliday junction branch migration protein RuvA, partial [Polyangiales bacterium]